jgi:hypothetical protein
MWKSPRKKNYFGIPKIEIVSKQTVRVAHTPVKQCQMFPVDLEDFPLTRQLSGMVGPPFEAFRRSERGAIEHFAPAQSARRQSEHAPIGARYCGHGEVPIASSESKAAN